ncbi:MAG TPA: glycosyltransferase [Sphingobacterium sp.]|nr:glycosyltransferase [Sphingobacterium sp.]
MVNTNIEPISISDEEIDFFNREFNRRYNLQKEFLPSDETRIPLVSIIVTVFNHEEYLRECLDSLLSQITSFEFEIIIGEDGSNDNSRAICIEYAEKYPNKIRLFLRDRDTSVFPFKDRKLLLNGAFTRKAIRGEYMAWCEGDDFWIDNSKLQVQFDFMERNRDCSLCFHTTKKIDENTKEEVVVRPVISEKESEAKFNAQQILSGIRESIMTASIFMRSSVIKNLPYWVYLAPTSDTTLIFLALKQGNVGFLNKTMASYRKFSSNSWSNQKLKSLEGYAKTIPYRLFWLDKYDEITVHTYKKQISVLKRKIIADFLMNSFVVNTTRENWEAIIKYSNLFFKIDMVTARVWRRFFLNLFC